MNLFWNIYYYENKNFLKQQHPLFKITFTN